MSNELRRGGVGIHSIFCLRSRVLCVFWGACVVVQPDRCLFSVDGWFLCRPFHFQMFRVGWQTLYACGVGSARVQSNGLCRVAELLVRRPRVTKRIFACSGTCPPLCAIKKDRTGKHLFFVCIESRVRGVRRSGLNHYIILGQQHHRS